MYLYLSLGEIKVAEFYHNMVKMTYFHRFLQTIDGVLTHHSALAVMGNMVASSILGG